MVRLYVVVVVVAVVVVVVVVVCDQCSVAGVSTDCLDDWTSIRTGHMLMLVVLGYASACDGPSLAVTNRAVHIQCS